MRDFKGMKRQRGRNRTSGGAPSGGGGGGKPQQNVNRAFDSNGPDNVKIRGHAQHVFEKYQQLARDAFSSGDRVLAENYLQHADHYFRVLRTIQPNRAPAEILGRDVFASGLDIDFEDDAENNFEDGPTTEPATSESADNGEQPQRFENGRGEQRYENGRDNNRYEGRSDNNRQDYRQDRQDGARSDNNRHDRQDASRQDGSRQDAPRQDNSRRDERPDRYESRQGGQEPRRDSQENGRYESRRDGQDNGRANGRYAENRDNRSDQPRADRDEPRRDELPRETREPRTESRRDYQEPRAQEPRTEPRRDYQEPREAIEAPRDEVRDAPSEGRSRRQRAPREGRYGARADGDVQSSDVQSSDAPAADVMAVVEPETTPLPFTPAPKAEPEAAPVLRSQDGGVSEAPAFLQAPTAAEDGEVRKPRVRRRRPKALDGEDGEAVSPVAEDA